MLQNEAGAQKAKKVEGSKGKNRTHYNCLPAQGQHQKDPHRGALHRGGHHPKGGEGKKTDRVQQTTLLPQGASVPKTAPNGKPVSTGSHRKAKEERKQELEKEMTAQTSMSSLKGHAGGPDTVEKKEEGSAKKKREKQCGGL